MVLMMNQNQADAVKLSQFESKNSATLKVQSSIKPWEANLTSNQFQLSDSKTHKFYRY